MKRTISVAMATFNGEKYLRQQLDSIYSQTHIPDEVVVVDDFSNDKTSEILQEYHINYGLFYIINEKRLGLNKNFEKAISKCNGDYIALSDQDDVWMPNKIEMCLKVLNTNYCDLPQLVSSSCIYTDSELKWLEVPVSDKDSKSYATALLGHQSQGCTLIMNSSLKKYILPLPTDSKVFYDAYIGLTAAMIGYKYHIAQPLLYYRIHSTNTIARSTLAEQTIKNRIKARFRNRYPTLVSEERLYNMKYVATMHSQNFIEDRKSLFYKILSLDNKITIVEKSKIIISITELPFKDRLVVLANTLISHILHNNYKLIRNEIS